MIIDAITRFTKIATFLLIQQQKQKQTYEFFRSTVDGCVFNDIEKVDMLLIIPERLKLHV